MKNLFWFSGGLLAGLMILSISRASVSSSLGRITDDTAISQNLTELRVQKQAKIDFDSDIKSLAKLEPRYRESLPSLADQARVKSAIKRISGTHRR